MKEYSKGIYVKFKPEEVEILHDRMKEAGVQNMSAYIRKMAINGYVIIPEWPDLNRVISLHARAAKASLWNEKPLGAADGYLGHQRCPL